MAPLPFKTDNNNTQITLTSGIPIPVANDSTSNLLLSCGVCHNISIAPFQQFAKTKFLHSWLAATAKMPDFVSCCGFRITYQPILYLPASRYITTRGCYFISKGCNENL
jgi:hypothetical protein